MEKAVVAPLPAGQVGKTEEVNPFAGQVGKWSFSMNDPGPDLKKLSSASRNKIRKELQAIAGIVTSTPAMNPPKGYEARFWGSIAGKDRFDICAGKSCPPSRPNAALAMMIGRYEEKNGKRRAAFNTPSTMDISINTLGHVFAHLPVIYKDKDGFLLPEPQRDGERLGMPAYLNNGHAIAVLTRNDKPFWLPVNRERYLKAAMEDIGKDLGLPSPPLVDKGKKKAEELITTSGKPIMVEESKAWIDPANERELIENSRSLTEELKDSAEQLQERLNQLQSELDALTPEQRSMQARVEIKVTEDGTRVTLLPPDSSGGIGVVTPDFDFFNKKLAPEAVQLVVVQWKFDGNPIYDPEKTGIPESLNNRALLEIYRSMDWQKLLGKTVKATRTAP
jgi:hypothetical protein